MKVKDLIEKLSQFDGEYPIYVLSYDDGVASYEEANKVEFDMGAFYITYDKGLAEKESKRLNLFKERNKLITRLDENNNDLMLLCEMMELEKMEDLINDSKKIKADIKKIEQELGWE